MRLDERQHLVNGLETEGDFGHFWRAGCPIPLELFMVLPAEEAVEVGQPPYLHHTSDFKRAPL